MAAVGLIPEYKILDDNEDGGLSAVHYVAQVCIRKFNIVFHHYVCDEVKEKKPLRPAFVTFI